VTGNADFGALGAYHLALDLSAFVSENKLTVPADLLSKIEALSLKLRTTEIHHHEDPLSWYATRQSNELRKAFGIPPFVSDRERSQLFDEKFSEVEEVQRHDRSPSVSRPACVGIAAAVIAVAGFACFEGLRASSLPRDSVSTPERSPGKEPDRDTLAKAEKAAIEIQNAHSTVAQIFEISTGVKLDAFVSGTASPESLLRLDKLVLSRTKMGDLSARSLDNLRELSGEINEKLKSWEAEPNKTDLKATALLTWADGTMERLDSLAEEARIVGTFLKSSSEAWE
jgi:hypothetical protein